MGRVVLHVGLPKTGTSFLQGVLRENEPLLASHGLRVPAIRHQDLFAAVLHLTDRSTAWGRSPAAGRRAWRRVLADLAESTDRASVTVISSETLCLAQPRHVTRVLTDLRDAGVEDVDVVATVRDLARQLPAEWQEGVKHGRRGSYPVFLRAVLTDPPESDGAARRRHRRFWSAQDPVAVLDRWAAHLPADRVHVVVNPPPGAPPEELWRRFATSLGLTAAAAAAVDLPAAQVNASLGAVQLEVLRRVNQRFTRQGREKSYGTVAKRLYAGSILRRQHGTRLTLPPRHLDAATQRSDTWAAGIRERGWQVVGDLAELVPAPAPAPAPASSATAAPRVTRAAMLQSSVDATAGLLEEVERLAAENAALRRSGRRGRAGAVPGSAAVRRGLAAVRTRATRRGAEA